MKALLANTNVLALIDQAVISGSNFLLGLMLARFLGFENFGVYSVVLIVILFFGELQRSLVVVPMLTIAGKLSVKELPLYLSSLIVLQIIISFYSIVTIWVISGIETDHYIFESVRNNVAALLLNVFARHFYELARRVKMVSGDWLFVLKMDIIIYSGILALVLFYAMPNRLTVALVLYTSAAVFLLGSLVLFKIVFSLTTINVDNLTDVIKRHWGFGKWLVVNAIFQWMTGNYLILFAGSIFGVALVGAVRACQNLIGLLNIIFLAADSVIPVKLARLYPNRIEDMRAYLKKCYITISIAPCLLFACFILFGDQLMVWIFGLEYGKYHDLLIVLSLSSLLVASGIVIQQLLKVVENTRGIMIGNMVAAIFIWVAATPMLSYFGYLGIGVGLTLSQVVFQFVGVGVLDYRKVLVRNA